MEQLLDHDLIDVNTRCALGRTALHDACCRGNIAVAQLLLDDGRSDLSIRDNHGRTPADCALMMGAFDVLELLSSETTTRCL